MPVLSQGNIFDAVPRVQLTIVFGHLGFNQLKQYWEPFAKQHPNLRRLYDPFSQRACQPVECNEHFLWFVPEQDNHGMTDVQLTAALDDALNWAKANQLESVATNGIASSGRRSHDAALNRQMDDHRATYLIAYATRAEEALGIRFELISLNDIFVRNGSLAREEGV